MKSAERESPARLFRAMREEASRHYQSDAAAALRIAQRAVRMARPLADPLATGWAQRALAESLLFAGRIREAEEAYEQAARAWRAAGADALLGQLLVGRIHVLALLGNMSAVRGATEEARARLERAGDRTYLAKLAMNLGNLHFQRDEYAEALAEYEQAAAIFARLRVVDPTTIGLEVNRAVALTQRDRDREALALFNTLEKECRRRGLDLLQAQVWMNRAWVHALRAEFDLALEDLARATDYFRRTGHPAFLASCLINRAEVYHQLNLHPDATLLAEEAAALFEGERMHYDQALALFQSVLSRLAAGESISPVAIRRARALFQRERNPARVALTRLVWGEILARAGRKAGALAQVQEALASFRSCGLIRWEATATRRLCDLQKSALAPRRRITLLRDILVRLPERIYPLQAQQLLESMGDAQADAGQLAQAENSYVRAVNKIESLRIRVPTEDSKIAFLGDKTHLYDRLLRLEIDRPRARAARLFSWMERARAQSLWDRVRDPARWNAAPSAPGGRSAERQRISWLHARISRLELGTAEEGERARELRLELARAEREWTRGLRREGEARGLRRVADSGASEAGITLPELSRALPSGWGFLSFHLGRGVSLALAVTREGALWRELAHDLPERVGALARRLDFQWSAAAAASARRTQFALRQAAPGGAGAPSRPAAFEPDPPAGPSGHAGDGTGVANAFLLGATDAVLTELYKLLWRPLEEAGLPPEMNWIVSPHGATHRLPLAALRSRDGYLAERIDFAHVPSARAWRELPARRRSRTRRAWVGGVISPGLPAIRTELKRVASRLGGWDVVTSRAPTSAALHAEGSRADLIHLAAHGSLRTDNPAYSFLELSDGPLFVHDLAGFHLPGSTLVLTACSSGRGVAPAGDEWVGLARGFLQAGASTVVASLWPIDDAVTVELIDLFYSRYASGMSAARAMGQARRDLLPHHPHPWHWASFAVLGGVEELVPQPKRVSGASDVGDHPVAL